MNGSLHKKSGFTLLELLIVIGIVGVLAAVLLEAINPLEQFVRSRDAGRLSSVKQLGQALQRYASLNGGTYPPLVANWQTNILKSTGEISKTIFVSQVGTTQCGSSGPPNAEGNICYSTSLSSGSPDAIIWTIAESKNYQNTGGCSDTQTSVIAWIATQGIGITCFPSPSTIPTPDPSNNTYDTITLYTFSHPNTAPTPTSGPPTVTPTPTITPTPLPTPPSAFDIIADFGSRSNHTFTIPNTFLGIGGLGMNNVLPQMNSYLPLANFQRTRFGDFNYSTIFPNFQSVTDDTQRVWTPIDNDFNTIIAAHAQGAVMQPIVVLSYTPIWMESYSDVTCNDATHVRPTYIQNSVDIGYQLWGQLSAAVVHHIAVNFMKNNSWLKPMYEIWNEPNGTGYMCEPSTMSSSLADQTRLTTWLSLYDAAAPLMRTQAQSDGVTIKIGGPAHSYPLQQQLTEWFPAFVTGTYVNAATGANFSADTNITNNIDFISYHHYTSGLTLNGGSGSMVANAQDTSKGIEAIYDGVDTIVHTQGTYPGHQTTPIFIDEYNANPCQNAPTPCRNDPVMAPLTNGLYIIDFLNTIFDTAPMNGPAKVIPGGMVYFTWSIPSGGYCMFGINDLGSLDCHKNGTLQPYPQYYAYELVGGLNYLNLESNAYDANFVTSNNSGVFASAFYNNSTENILIDNMNTIDYPNFAIRLQNPGTVTHFTGAYSFISYNINSPDSSLTTNQVTILPVNGDYYAIVHLPPNTLAGLSVTY